MADPVPPLGRDTSQVAFFASAEVAVKALTQAVSALTNKINSDSKSGSKAGSSEDPKLKKILDGFNSIIQQNKRANDDKNSKLKSTLDALPVNVQNAVKQAISAGLSTTNTELKSVADAIKKQQSELRSLVGSLDGLTRNDNKGKKGDNGFPPIVNALNKFTASVSQFSSAVDKMKGFNPKSATVALADSHRASVKNPKAPRGGVLPKSLMDSAEALSQRLVEITDNFGKLGQAKDALIKNFERATKEVDRSTDSMQRRDKAESKSGKETDSGGESRSSKIKKFIGIEIEPNEPSLGKVISSFQSAGALAGGVFKSSFATNRVIEPLMEANKEIARMSGQLFGASNAANAMGNSFTKMLISTTQSTGASIGDLKGMMDMMVNESNLSLITSAKMSETIVNGARSLGLFDREMGIIAATAADVSESLMTAGENAIPTMLQGMGRTAKQFQLSGRQMDAVSRVMSGLVKEMRQFGYVSAEAYGEMLKLGAISRQLGTSEITQRMMGNRKSFSSLLQNFTMLDGMINNQLIKSGMRLSDVLSGAWQRTAEGQRRYHKASAQSFTQLQKYVALMPEEFANLYLEQATNGLIKSKDELMRAKKTEEQAGESADERLARLSKLRTDIISSGGGDTAFGVERLRAEGIKGGSQGLDEAIMRAQEDVKSGPANEAAEAISRAAQLQASSNMSAEQAWQETSKGYKSLAGTTLSQANQMAETASKATQEKLSEGADEATQSAQDKWTIAVEKGLGDLQSTFQGFTNELTKLSAGSAGSGFFGALQAGTTVGVGAAASVGGLATLWQGGKMAKGFLGSIFGKGSDTGGITGTDPGAPPLPSPPSPPLPPISPTNMGNLAPPPAPPIPGQELQAISKKWQQYRRHGWELAKTLVLVVAVAAMLGASFYLLNLAWPEPEVVLSVSAAMAASIPGLIAMGAATFALVKASKAMPMTLSQLGKALGNVVGTLALVTSVGFLLGLAMRALSFAWPPSQQMLDLAASMKASIFPITLIAGVTGALAAIGAVLSKNAALLKPVLGGIAIGLGAMALTAAALTLTFNLLTKYWPKANEMNDLASSMKASLGPLAYLAGITVALGAVGLLFTGPQALALVPIIGGIVGGLAALAYVGIELGAAFNQMSAVWPDSTTMIDLAKSLDASSGALSSLGSAIYSLAVIGFESVVTNVIGFIPKLLGFKSPMQTITELGVALGTSMSIMAGAFPKPDVVLTTTASIGKSIQALVSLGRLRDYLAGIAIEKWSSLGLVSVAVSSGLKTLLDFGRTIASSINELYNTFTSQAGSADVADRVIKSLLVLKSLGQVGEFTKGFGSMFGETWAKTFGSSAAMLSGINILKDFAGRLSTSINDLITSFAQAPVEKLSAVTTYLSNAVKTFEQLDKIGETTKKYGGSTWTWFFDSAEDITAKLQSGSKNLKLVSDEMFKLIKDIQVPEGKELEQKGNTLASAATAFGSLATAAEKIYNVYGSKWTKSSEGVAVDVSAGMANLSLLGVAMAGGYKKLLSAWAGTNTKAVEETSKSLESSATAYATLAVSAKSFADFRKDKAWFGKINMKDINKGLDNLTMIGGSLADRMKSLFLKFPDPEFTKMVAEALKSSVEAFAEVGKATNELVKFKDIGKSPESLQPYLDAVKAIGDIASQIGIEMDNLISIFPDPKDTKGIADNLQSVGQSLQAIMRLADQYGADPEKFKSGIQKLVDVFMVGMAPLGDPAISASIKQRAELLNLMAKSLGDLIGSAQNVVAAQESFNTIMKLNTALDEQSTNLAGAWQKSAQAALNTSAAIPQASGSGQVRAIQSQAGTVQASGKAATALSVASNDVQSREARRQERSEAVKKRIEERSKAWESTSKSAQSIVDATNSKETRDKKMLKLQKKSVDHMEKALTGAAASQNIAAQKQGAAATEVAKAALGSSKQGSGKDNSYYGRGVDSYLDEMKRQNKSLPREISNLPKELQSGVSKAFAASEVAKKNLEKAKSSGADQEKIDQLKNISQLRQKDYQEKLKQAQDQTGYLKNQESPRKVQQLLDEKHANIRKAEDSLAAASKAKALQIQEILSTTGNKDEIAKVEEVFGKAQAKYTKEINRIRNTEGGHSLDELYKTQSKSNPVAALDNAQKALKAKQDSFKSEEQKIKDLGKKKIQLLKSLRNEQDPGAKERINNDLKEIGGEWKSRILELHNRKKIELDPLQKRVSEQKKLVDDKASKLLVGMSEKATSKIDGLKLGASNLVDQAKGKAKDILAGKPIISKNGTDGLVVPQISGGPMKAVQAEMRRQEYRPLQKGMFDDEVRAAQAAKMTSKKPSLEIKQPVPSQIKANLPALAPVPTTNSQTELQKTLGAKEKQKVEMMKKAAVLIGGKGMISSEPVQKLMNSSQLKDNQNAMQVKKTAGGASSVATSTAVGQAKIDTGIYGNKAESIAKIRAAHNLAKSLGTNRLPAGVQYHTENGVMTAKVSPESQKAAEDVARSMRSDSLVAPYGTMNSAITPIVPEVKAAPSTQGVGGSALDTKSPEMQQGAGSDKMQKGSLTVQSSILEETKQQNSLLAQVVSLLSQDHSSSVMGDNKGMGGLASSMLNNVGSTSALPVGPWQHQMDSDLTGPQTDV